MSSQENSLDTGQAGEAESILDALPQPMICIDDDFKVVRLSRSSLEFIGTDSSSAIGDHCYRLLYNRESICPYCPVQNEWADRPGVINTAPSSIEKIIQTREAEEEKSYRLSFTRVGGPRIQIMEMIEDITGQREKQEETMRMEKLAAIGTMISGVAHELNNPLTGMELNLQNLVANLPTMNVQEVTKRLTMVRKDLNRAARVVQDILNFSRIEELQLSRADMNMVVQRAKANVLRLYPVMSRKVEWRLYAGDDVTFYYNAEKMERLFINLFKNSIQALDYGEGYIRFNMKSTNNVAHILVEDNAGGIAPDDLKYIFNPFYTNSQNGRGSGLGLSICHNIVEEHKGKIQVQSSGGKTRFHIILPTHTGSDD